MKYIAEVEVRKMLAGGFRPPYNSDPIASVRAETIMRISAPSNYGTLPSARIRAYPEDNVLDDEGDACSLASFEIERADIDLFGFPTITIYGDLRELRVAPNGIVEKSDGEARYVPAPDKTWEPCLVEVRITPVSITYGPDE